MASLIAKKLMKLPIGASVELTYDEGDVKNQKLIGVVSDNDGEESLEIRTREGDELIIDYSLVRSFKTVAGSSTPAPVPKPAAAAPAPTPAPAPKPVVRKPLYQQAPVETLNLNDGELKNLFVPDSVTSIEYKAFNNCGKLNKITFLGSNVKTIGDSAFVDCKALGKIDLPEGVEEIGYQSFYGCKKLSAIVLPSTVKKIGKVAFGSCKALAKVTLGANVEEISDDAFDGCAKKITFIAPEGSYAWNWATAKGFAVKVPK